MKINSEDKGENMENNNDKLIIGKHEFSSRFILGSGKYSLDPNKCGC